MKHFVLVIFLVASILGGFIFLVKPIFRSTDSTPNFSLSCPLYNVRGVDISLSSPKTASYLGTEISFVATVSNKNPFTVTDGSLLIKIEGADGSLLDQFVVENGQIVIGENSSYKTKFSWKAPSFAVSGKYIAKAYFISADKFNLGGVTFIDGLSAGEMAFSLSGENKKFVSFDKSSLSINGIPYLSPAGVVAGLSDRATVLVSVRHNLFVKTNALVTWRVYKWDGITEDNLLGSYSGKITLTPGAPSRLQFSFDDHGYSSYQVVAEIKWMDAKSILQARVIQSGVSDSQLRLLATSPSSDVFGCIDNTLVRGDEDSFPKTLKFRAIDASGRVIANKSFEIPRSLIAGFSGLSTSGSNGKSITLTAEIFSKKGVLIDSAKVFYDCEKVGASVCGSGNTKIADYVKTGIILGGVISLFFIIRRHRKGSGSKSYLK